MGRAGRQTGVKQQPRFFGPRQMHGIHTARCVVPPRVLFVLCACGVCVGVCICVYLLLEQAAKHAMTAKPKHLRGQTRLTSTPALTCKTRKKLYASVKLATLNK